MRPEIWHTSPVAYPKRRVVVVGSGIAGLTCARDLAIAGWEVEVLSPGQPGHDGASHRLHGMAPFILMAAPWVRGDSPRRFAAELDRRAEGLRRPGLAEVLAAAAHPAAQELMTWLKLCPLAREPLRLPGEDVARGLPCRPDHPGALMEPALEDVLRAGVTFRQALVVGLRRNGERITGVVGVGRGQPGLEEVAANAVVLACGGPSGVFPVATGPRWCRGSNLVLGELAGALLHQPSLVQALPLTLRPPGFFLTSRVLLEARLAVAGCGVRPVETMGQMLAVMSEAARAGHSLTASLDLSAYDLLPPRFPLARLAPPGCPVPLGVGCHHGIGGVAIDLWGRTSVPGLYACGEAAGGVQGRRRMMGTGLLEGYVFGRRVARAVDRDRERQASDPGGATSTVLAPVAPAADLERALDGLAQTWLVGGGPAPSGGLESGRPAGGFAEYMAAVRVRALAIMMAAGRV